MYGCIDIFLDLISGDIVNWIFGVIIDVNIVSYMSLGLGCFVFGFMFKLVYDFMGGYLILGIVSGVK